VFDSLVQRSEDQTWIGFTDDIALATMWRCRNHALRARLNNRTPRLVWMPVSSWSAHYALNEAFTAGFPGSAAAARLEWRSAAVRVRHETLDADTRLPSSSRRSAWADSRGGA